MIESIVEQQFFINWKRDNKCSKCAFFHHPIYLYSLLFILLNSNWINLNKTWEHRSNKSIILTSSLLVFTNIASRTRMAKSLHQQIMWKWIFNKGNYCIFDIIQTINISQQFFFFGYSEIYNRIDSMFTTCLSLDYLWLLF